MIGLYLQFHLTTNGELMLKFIALFTGILCFSTAFGQATLFSDDFESGMGSWIATDDLTPNYFHVQTCAGNGTTLPGSNAMYITIGGPNPGCGALGEDQYAYSNSPAGVQMATQYVTVDATCANALIAEFDYKIDGVVAEDFAELVYSTDGGITWTPVWSAVTAPSWATAIVPLGGALDNSIFDLAFRFTYNDATIGGIPLAVDNIRVFGSDLIDPVMTCPDTLSLAVDLNCQALCSDYTDDMLTLSDNCTDSSLIVVTQDIPEFTIFGTGPGGFEQVVVTATDEAGNSTQCSITLSIIDDTNPTIICPADTNVYVDNNCDGTLEDYTGDVIIDDNCTAIGNLIVTQSPPVGTIVNGVIVDTDVTMTVSDESGNTASCIFVARTIDTLVATITCPADTNIYANNGCLGTLDDYTGEAVASDNCTPASSLTITQSPVPGANISADQIITLTVSGAVPNIDQSCTFTAFLIDTINPSIVCPTPTDLFVDNNCEAILPNYAGSAIVSDNCTAAPTIAQSPLPGTIVNTSSSVTVTLTVTDASGNTDSCQFAQPVYDTVSPSAICPSDQNEIADANCFATIADYTGLVTATDNCAGVLSYVQSPSAGTSISTSIQVSITVTDLEGNSDVCSFNVNPIDTTAPAATCPLDSIVGLDNSCSYTVPDFTGDAVGADNCTPAGSLIYTQSLPVGTILNGEGLWPIAIDIEDASGNIGQCTFLLTVEDQQAPNIAVCPSNQNVIADSSCTATLGDYTGLTLASDNCSSGSLIFGQSPTPGTSISSNTVITILVLDAVGNSTSCTFSALIVDTIAPSVTCPGDQNVSINSSCEYTMPDLTSMVAGSDNCSALANMTITQNPAAGTTQNGTTATLITLTDEDGNQATCFTNILPIDTVAPTITCPSPAPVDNGTTCDYVLPNFGTGALVLDNCSGYTIDQIPAPATVVSTDTNTITLTVTDAGGNTAQCTFDLIVYENQAPTITCPSDTVSCDPVVSYSSPTFGDNCLVSMSQTDGTGLSSGTTFPVGVTTLEYTAVDSSGNMQTCTFNIEILDYPSPAIIADDTLFLCDEAGTLVTADPITSGTGEWTVFSGQGNFNNQFANSTGVNNIGIGTNVYVWTVSSASCGTLSDTLVVINDELDLPASTQSLINACQDDSVLLQANVPLYGVGTWTTNGTGVIDDINSASTYSSVGEGWQEFVWTITNGSCPATSDTLFVFVTTSISIDQEDTLVCLENDLITLSGTPPAQGETSSWSVISGGATLTDPNAPITNAYDFDIGGTLILYTISHPVCESVYDTISISGNLCDGFDPIIPTVITPGNIDGKNDEFVIDFLDDLYPDCRVVIFNRWGSIVYESTGYSDPWDGTYKGEYLPMGTYFYRVDLNDGSGEVLKGDISIIH